MIQHFKQITPDKFLEIDKDTSVIPQILRDDEHYPQISIDQSWDGIHFLLAGKIAGDNFDQSNPKEWIMVGWGEWGPDVGYGPSRFVAPKEVTQLANYLSKLRDEDLKKNFDPAKMNELGAYPDGVWDEENILDWLMENYHKVKDFYINAAKGGNAVLIWTD